MEGDSTEPKTFSYPNADRPINDSGEITGPEPVRDPRLSQEQLRQTVHLNDALKDKNAERPSDMQNIRTFQSDVANAVKTDNVSLIKIALSEKRRQERQGTLDSALGGPSTSKNGLYMGIAGIVVLLVGGGLFLYSSINSRTPAPVADNTTLSTPNFETEKTLNVDIRGKDSDDIERIVQTEKAGELSLGAMERIRFTQTNDTGVVQELDTASWLNFMKVRAPDSLIRAFDPGFIFGIYSLTPHDSFIILKVSSYDNAYAGMLQWEPNMEDDIGGIVINKRPATAIGDNATTSTSTSSLNQFNGKPFVDRVINNKDTRVLLDDNGNIKILYSFVDQNTLVITSGESVLREVIFRLTTGRISR